MPIAAKSAAYAVRLYGLPSQSSHPETPESRAAKATTAPVGVMVCADGLVDLSAQVSTCAVVPSPRTTARDESPRTASSRFVAAACSETVAVTSPCGEVTVSGTASSALVAGLIRRCVPPVSPNLRLTVNSGAPSCTAASTVMYGPPATDALESGGTGVTGCESL